MRVVEAGHGVALGLGADPLLDDLTPSARI